ncbi:MAG: YncE family protein [Gemmatimonadales bacterium]|nr:YncE family protein [Gemmatimonadales bacterium]
MKRPLIALALLAGCASAGQSAGVANCHPDPERSEGEGAQGAPCPLRSAQGDTLHRDYLVFVASEGNDRIALVRFGQGKARVEREQRIGINPTELVGPHGLYVSPDGRWYFVTTAHGTPNGALWKFSTATDEPAGRVELGLFPATVQVAPNSHYAWVVNFNLYGEMTPSSVSVVYTDDMLEVRRIPTCVMPHGSRLSPDGKRHYSACMMNDALVEIDADRMELTRHFVLTAAAEHGMTGPVHPVEAGGKGSHSMSPALTCSPTWAEPSADGRTVWVACSKSNDVVEIDVVSWAMKRRVPAGEGIYNLAASRDGRVIVGTNKRGQSVSVIDAASGRELARIATTRRVPSGLVISPDSRFAFVTQEGVGSEPGTVDVIDLRTLGRVASVDLGQQAGGIGFWKSEPPAE